MRRIVPLVLLALAACGQKGNLYLPDEGTEVAPVSTSPAAVTPAGTAPAGNAPAGEAQDPDRDNPGARRN